MPGDDSIIDAITTTSNRSRDGWRTPASIAVATGLAVAGVVLTGYAVAHRHPDGWVGDFTSHQTDVYLVIAAVAMPLVALAVMVTAGVVWWRRSADRDLAGLVLGLLLVASLGLGWLWLGEMSSTAAGEFDAPLLPPVVTWIRWSGAILVAAWLVLLIGAVRPTSLPRKRRVSGAVMVVALTSVVFLGIGLVIGAHTTRAFTVVEPIPVPPPPVTVEGTVAYSIPARETTDVLPAGPGFVVRGDHGLAAYDGATGERRWSIEFAALGGNCGGELSRGRQQDYWWSRGVPGTAVRSTGAGLTSIIAVTCGRRVFGVDAMTGSVRWVNTEGWDVYDATPDVISVTKDDRSSQHAAVAAMDPGTGKVRWVMGASDCTDATQLTVVGHVIVHEDRCSASGRWLRMVNVYNGTERYVVMPAWTSPSSKWTRRLVTVLARSGSTVAIEVSMGNVDGRTWDTGIVAIDTNTRDARSVVPHGTRTEYFLPDRQRFGWALSGAITPLGSQSEQAMLLRLPAGRVGLYSARVPLFSDYLTPEQWWTLVGNTAVTAMGYYGSHAVVTIAPDGRVTSRPGPCGRDEGGVMTVPGALLVLCMRTDAHSYKVTSVDVVGLR
ncbi:hypothetical protein [Gordonia sp. NPDC003422]